MQRFLFVVMLLPIFSSSAQLDQDERIATEASLIEQSLSQQKHEIISSSLNLSEESSRDFWKIYYEYETARLKLAVVRFQLMAEYTQNHISLDDASTDKLCKKWLRNDLAYVKLKKKYYRLFRKATSAAEASEFFRLENQINIAIDSRFHNSLLQG